MSELKHFALSILKFYKPYKFYTTLFIMGLLFELIVESFVALSFKFLIDQAIIVKNEQAIVLVLMLLIIGTTIAKFGYVFRSYLYAKVTNGINRDLQNKLFDRLQNQTVNYLSSTSSGEILSLFSTDLSSIKDLTYMALPAGFAALIGIFINLVIIFVLEWKLAGIALFGLFLCVLGPLFLSGRVSKANDQAKKMQADLVSTVEENLSAYKVVKAFNLLNLSQEKFERKTQAFFEHSTKTTFLNDLMEIAPNVAIDAIKVLIICVGAYMAFNDYITAGTLVSFNSLFIGLSSAVWSLTWVFPLVMTSIASIYRIQAFMPEDQADQGDNTLLSPDEFCDSIVFEKVTFGYTADQEILKDINFEIKKGQTVAFVGKSGSGKSSILNLMMQFYAPKSGSIQIDGIDLNRLSAASVREMTGIVLQDNFLFNQTIRENILITKPDASEEDLYQAAMTAQVHEVILKMANGYDTLVGDRGGLLSGGQRQRIALARALIKNPSILILDEATSALDPKTEKMVISALDGLKQQMTIVSITHRLENIKNYDVIYVMDSGQVVESGSHQSLISQNGVYAELNGKQSGFIITDDLKHAEIEIGRLAKIDLFKKLEYEMLSELAEGFMSEYYIKGQDIIKLGEEGDRFYVIARGRAEVIIELDSGAERIVNVLDDGDYFGEIALLREVPRTATIRATQPSLILSLSRKQFDHVISKTPQIREKLEMEMDARLDQLRNKKKAV